MREFIMDEAYLGGITIVIESRDNRLTAEIYRDALKQVFERIASEISAIREVYIGTAEFKDYLFKEVFKNKSLHIAVDGDKDKELGTSQSTTGVPNAQIDLIAEDWFVFNDNYDTSEEKAFVKYFSTHVANFRKKYEKVYLVRNERQLVLYSFDGGERFEPDYLLFLLKKNGTGYEQYQIFVEPKGAHLIQEDKWKEDFLLQINARGKAKTTFVDDNDYRIIGFPFYNDGLADKKAAVTDAITKLL
jgi:type III restriction enzyme